MKNLSVKFIALVIGSIISASSVNPSFAQGFLGNISFDSYYSHEYLTFENDEENFCQELHVDYVAEQEMLEKYLFGYSKPRKNLFSFRKTKDYFVDDVIFSKYI